MDKEISLQDISAYNIVLVIGKECGAIWRPLGGFEEALRGVV